MKLCIELTFSSAAWTNLAIEADETPWDSGVALGNRIDFLTAASGGCDRFTEGFSWPKRNSEFNGATNKLAKANQQDQARIRKVPRLSTTSK
jgi:hypothetical protein